MIRTISEDGYTGFDPGMAWIPANDKIRAGKV